VADGDVVAWVGLRDARQVKRHPVRLPAPPEPARDEARAQVAVGMLRPAARLPGAQLANAGDGRVDPAAAREGDRRLLPAHDQVDPAGALDPAAAGPRQAPEP
jgi:hypothetical protein